MDEQILIRFLTHQCSADEVEQIEQWIALDKTNAERFFEIERIWSLKEELKFTEKKEVESAYNHFVSIIEKKETAIIAKSKCATFSIEMYTKTPFKYSLKGVQNINTFYPSSELYNLQTVLKRIKGN